MNPKSKMLREGDLVSIRLIQPADFEQISPHAYSVSITEPLNELAEIERVFDTTGFWQPDSGAVAITENVSGRLVGTCQYFRSGPCIHGLEIGYIVHDEADRKRGFATEGLQLLSDHLFQSHVEHQRHQLTIETTNIASYKVGEKCGFSREGILRSSGFGDSLPDCYVYSRLAADR